MASVAAKGDVPFSEPYWALPNARLKNPHLKPKHLRFRDKMRAWVDKELIPFVDDWEKNGSYPRALHEKCYQAGIYGITWPEQYGGTPPEGGMDSWYSLIFTQELCRCAAGGLIASLFSIGIGLPPIIKAGSANLKQEVVPDLVRGKKIIALAITEPQAGSDVARIRTTAVKQTDDNGDEYYLINGTKKFITSGVQADYFTTAVRTGPKGSGMFGLSLIVIPSHLPGVRSRKLDTMGWRVGNTAFLSFENVRVPARYLVGQEGMGFKLIMINFNSERYAMAGQAIAYARVCLTDAIDYARSRKTFGKRLIDHQVIRHKIAEMAFRVEAAYAWLEQITYHMDNNARQRDLATYIALAKVMSTRTMEFCAREAMQILGGAGYLRTGKGRRVERIYREVRVMAIGGGSEEIMLDLGMRMAKL